MSDSSDLTMHGFWLVNDKSYVISVEENRIGQIFKQNEKKSEKDYKEWMLDPHEETAPIYTVFPWVGAEQMMALRDYHGFITKKNPTWQQMWGMSISELWHEEIPNYKAHIETFCRHRYDFFANHVKAVWKIEGDNTHLVHLRSVFKHNECDVLGFGFFLMKSVDVIGQLKNNKKLNLLSDEEKARRYPWSSGAKGWILIQKYPKTKYQELSNFLEATPIQPIPPNPKKRYRYVLESDSESESEENIKIQSGIDENEDNGNDANNSDVIKQTVLERDNRAHEEKSGVNQCVEVMSSLAIVKAELDQQKWLEYFANLGPTATYMIDFTLIDQF